MSQKVKIWKALLDWTVLTALIISFVYLAIWTVQYIRMLNLATAISEKQTQLREHNVNMAFDSVISPKLFIKSMEKDISVMTELDQSLSKTITLEKDSMLAECKTKQEGAASLQQTATLLSLTYELAEGLCNNVGDTSLSLINEQRLKAFDEETNLKNIITGFYEAEKKAGRFANPLWDKTPQEISAQIRAMTTAEKAGQLLMWGISGTSLSGSEQNDLTKYPVTGIILMGYNISDPAQTAKLTARIQSTNNKVPLLIATDQEGGVVKRVKWDTTAGPKDWASKSDADMCALSGTRARVLKSAGINTNLAPVVDLTYPGAGFINNRTISDQPGIVSAKAKSFVSCSQNEGVITSIKHFPGHGATAADSHISLPVITKTKAEWLQSDALPFINNSEAGMIMTGQLVMQNLDSENSATTSYKIITEVLRGELGYKGLIITDDMNQLYTSTREAWDASLEKAILAGNDIILYVGMPASKDRIYNKVVSMIENGTLSESELSSRLLRIIEVKSKLH